MQLGRQAGRHLDDRPVAGTPGISDVLSVLDLAAALPVTGVDGGAGGAHNALLLPGRRGGASNRDDQQASSSYRAAQHAMKQAEMPPSRHVGKVMMGGRHCPARTCSAWHPCGRL